MNNSRKTYHYTNINSLALILKNKTIRFTRLDGVDDIREAQKHAGINFGRYFFVSCWTKQSKESIPQWSMYSQNMQGVRLEFPEYPFDEILMQSPKAWTGITINDELTCPITFDALFGETYFIVPNFNPRTNFASLINYVSDVESIYEGAIQKTVSKDGVSVELKVNRLYSLPFFKSIDWEFQKEYRFSLFAVPSKKVSTRESADSEYFGNWSQLMSNSFINNIDTGVKYIDIPISESILKDIVVRVGPRATSGDIASVEAILAQYAPGSNIEASSLTGVIRQEK